VLNQLAAEADFLSDYVLVGGSALSLRLCHRYSEDLDFFTYSDPFDKNQIIAFFRGKPHEIVNDDRHQLDLIFQGVKLSFFNAKWDFIRPEDITCLNVATLPQVAGMKVHALFLRATYRDYYDLYVLSMRMTLGEIYENARMFLEGLNYKLFSMALIYVDDIADDDISHLKPAYHRSRQQISEHFIARLKEQPRG
jgi:predicted nucleotidyltransferase component of viral defense system